MHTTPMAALDVPVPEKGTNYPDPFARRVAGRTKRKLGDFFGLDHFGVNLTELAPGAISSLLHHHATEDELIYVLQGTAILVLGEDEFTLSPGDCVGFKAGGGVGHHLVNRSDAPVTYLEIGNRSGEDVCEYPNDDLRASGSPDGGWVFTHKDGTPYE